jgi:hypothetical protein
MTSLTYIENGAGRLETRAWDGDFALELQNKRSTVRRGDQ